jgi:hypothetical protein
MQINININKIIKMYSIIIKKNMGELCQRCNVENQLFEIHGQYTKKDHKICEDCIDTLNNITFKIDDLMIQIDRLIDYKNDLLKELKKY